MAKGLMLGQERDHEGWIELGGQVYEVSIDDKVV